MSSHATPFRHSVDRSSQEGEKYSLERTSVSSDAPLNKDGEDVEAQLVTPAQPPPAQLALASAKWSNKLHRPSFHGSLQYYILDLLSLDVPVYSRVDSSSCRG
jgi:hypothetical protein